MSRRDAFVKAITAWFEHEARDLPWRYQRTGYTGLVSEAMLQQTQVARVVERFTAFMARFPTVAALADANEQDVLALWQGLGYYRRARLLHAAAKQIMADHGGQVPASPDALQSLPGVGRYTAGAIASIVFGAAAPIVDGNVFRVLARFDAFDAPMTESESQRWVWSLAETLVAIAHQPGTFNEGLMEFGATVCTPKSPACDRCPVDRSCRARQLGQVDAIPVPKPRITVQDTHHHAVVITRGDRTLMIQRPASGMWSNMWEPPTVEAAQSLSDEDIRAQLALPLLKLSSCGEYVHQTTHRRVVFHVFRGTTRARRGRWVADSDMASLPMSNAHRRVLDLAGR
ncbi:MAG: A/G-specific adenine glycosylase [Planctomycetota bacterium]